MNQLRIKFEKEKALLQQKLNFTETESKELRSQVEDLRKNNEQIIDAFEKNDKETRIETKHMEEFRLKHEAEMKQITDEFEAYKRTSSKELEQALEKVNEYELKIQLLITDFNTESIKLKEQLADLSSQKERLLEKSKALESQKNKIYEQIEKSFTEKIKYLENQITEKDQQHEDEISDLKLRSEESLAQLKSLFEQEKLRFERKLQDEKEKFEKHVSQLTEEWEQKTREDLQNHEEEVELLNEELKDKERDYQMEVQQLEHELGLKQQNIESLEKYLKETKESLNNLQCNHSSTMEQQLDSFNQERKAFLNKIESLSYDVSKFEKEIFSLKQRNEFLNMNHSKKEQSFDKQLKDLIDEKVALTKQIEEEKSQ